MRFATILTGVETMKALTIQQPWAWAIAEGIKQVENRVWSTSHRGELAIHAGKKWDEAGREFLERLGHSVPDDLPRGAIVAVVDLVDVVPYDGSQPQLFGPNLSADPFACGPQCWLLENVRRLDQPIPCRGAQGLWESP